MWFFGANALEELLYIPFSEFLCWLEWLGSGKALAVMWVFFSFGSLWKTPFEGVEEGGVGSAAGFALHRWQSLIPGKPRPEQGGKG